MVWPEVGGRAASVCSSVKWVCGVKAAAEAGVVGQGQEGPDEPHPLCSDKVRTPSSASGGQSWGAWSPLCKEERTGPPGGLAASPGCSDLMGEILFKSGGWGQVQEAPQG